MFLAIIWQAGFSRALKAGDQKNNTATIVADTSATGKLRLGKYNIYSGIPSMYIGHFELKEGGKYIVALSSDEDSYATGTFTYDAATNIIQWKTGFFWQKKWGGKITNTSGNATRILFDKVTYGDSNSQ
jgi:hypothetical protein